MTIVVTGSSGLLGRHVAAALIEAGHDVTGVDTAPPPVPNAWRHISADLTDLGSAVELIRDAEAVVHVAAIPRPTGRTARDVFATNVAAAYNVTEAAVLGGVSRLVYASSFSVTGYPFNVKPIAPVYLPLDAAHPTAPQDAYALSKWLGEEIVAAAVRRSEMVALSLRLPWIQTAETFYPQVEPIRSDPGKAAQSLWSYIDGRDAGEAFRAAIEKPVEGHLRLYVSAADTFMEEPTEALIAAAYPGTAMKRPITGTDCVFDLDETLDALGFAPRYSWRSYPVPAGREST
ncbi:MAG: NAD(P)-dependent oxidoreductase [Bauldia sp.]|uniref:NAD-dependent epimerase/dehydratase family protein n=1 Tax=Bauldia sp. TaxID=2575872 RepID=UPI001D71D9AA|nr:NAD(P)-dependent oxidoreductase [Bauldia sp.]MCB1494742.1 NAD(P)-dependent oxidoreductase [Bauldia sp.]